MRFFSILFALFFITTVNGQTNTDSTKSVEKWSFSKAPKIIKFSPLDIFSVVPTLGLDMEVGIRKGLSFQVGTGVVLPYLQFITRSNFNDYSRMGGYLLRGEGRVYMPVKTNRYVAIGLSFRHLRIKGDVPIGMEGFVNTNGQQDFAYFINTPMIFHRFNTKIDAKLGFQKSFVNGLVFDFYLGLSIRTTAVQSFTKIPEGGQIPDQGGVWNLRDNLHNNYLTPILGFKLGFNKVNSTKK